MTNYRKLAVAAMLVLAMAVVPCGSAFASQKVNRTKLTALIRNYRTKDSSFDVVNIGGFLMGLAKNASRLDRDEAAILKGIKSICVVDYCDCPEDIRKGFDSSLDRILPEEDLLVETKEDGSTMRIYGSLSGKGTRVEDVIIHVADEGALICLFGSIRMEDLNRIIED